MLTFKLWFLLFPCVSERWHNGCACPGPSGFHLCPRSDILCAFWKFISYRGEDTTEWQSGTVTQVTNKYTQCYVLNVVMMNKCNLTGMGNAYCDVWKGDISKSKTVLRLNVTKIWVCICVLDLDEINNSEIKTRCIRLEWKPKTWIWVRTSIDVSYTNCVELWPLWYHHTSQNYDSLEKTQRLAKISKCYTTRFCFICSNYFI